MEINIILPDTDDLDDMSVGELRYELRRLILENTKAPISCMKRKYLVRLIQIWRCIPKIERMLPVEINKDDYTEEVIEDITVLVPTLKKSSS